MNLSVRSFVASNQAGLVMMKKRSVAITANNFVAEWRFPSEGRSAAQEGNVKPIKSCFNEEGLM